MGKGLEESFQNILNQSEEEQLNIAQKNADIVYKYLCSTSDKETAVNLMLAVAGTFIAADGEYGGAEHSFLQEVYSFPVDFDIMATYVKKGADTDVIEKVDLMIDNAPANIKAAFISLGLALCCCDGILTPSEKMLLARYIL